MQRSFLELAVCPACHTELELEVFSQEAAEILEGALVCRDCRTPYPVRGGVPRLLPRELGRRERQTAQTFGWQWKRFSNLLLWDQQRSQFLDWLQPLTPEHFYDKVVLDGGCGMGRLTEVAATFGPAQLVGVDLSDAVEVAWQRLRGRQNVHIVQADLHHLPFRRGAEAPFDLAYATGVLHHLPDPQRGFRSILDHVRLGGQLHGWVYGKEGNEWIERLVSPIRTSVTSRLPPKALIALSTVLSLPLHAASRLIARGPGGRRIPYSAYLRWLGQFDLRHTKHVVFDHLGPPISHYLSREQLQTWFEAEDVELLSISRRNRNSWRFLVRRVGDQPELRMAEPN